MKDPLDRAWFAGSNEVKNVRNGPVTFELQRDEAETRFPQRPSTVYGRGSSAFGVRLLGVIYEGLPATDPQ